MTDLGRTTRPPFRQVLEDPHEVLDRLVTNISEGKVIPIIGPELLTVEYEGRSLTLFDYLAAELAADPQLRCGDLPEHFTLHHVVAACEDRVRRGIYDKIRRILNQTNFAIPEPLQKLARIEKFKLFVTTTFDPFLVRALNDVRFNGQERTTELAYVPKNFGRGIADLERGWKATGNPVVYHLFGPLSGRREYVASEEDTIEFLHSLQSDPPNILFDELKESDLLILGCSFPDWLARFFIRLAKTEPISDDRYGRFEVLADSRATQQPDLALFLDNFSLSTRIFPGGAVELVDRLYDEWNRRFGVRDPGPNRPDETPLRGAGASIFISYASEDRAAAENLYAALSGVADVWFDRRPEALRPAVDWDKEIRRSIDRCTLFIPIISQNAIRRREGYFRDEWDIAVLRRRRIDDDLPFLVPVVVDETPANSRGVKDEFWKYQVTRLPGGVTTPGFLEHIRESLEMWSEEGGG